MSFLFEFSLKIRDELKSLGVTFISNGDTEVVDILLRGNRSGDVGQSVYVGIQGGSTTPTSNVDNILIKTTHDAGGYVGWIKTGSTWKRFGPISKSGEVQAYAFDTLEVTGLSTFSGGQKVTGNVDVTGSVTVSATVTAEQLTSTDDANISGTCTAGDFVGNGTIPIGGIIMWSGTDGSVPSNWQLCNGTNGTPNLIDKFIVGRGSAYAADSTGGSADAIVPTHTHTATGGSHGHPVRHSTQQTGAVTADASGGYILDNTGTQDFAANNSTPGSTSGDQIGQSGSLSLTAAAPAGSSSVTNANLPPYYAIAYIMRIS